MREKIIALLGLSILLTIGSCCKDKDVCNSDYKQIEPFIEKYGHFFCGGNDYEYTYILRSKAQVDSLADCTFSPPIPFPVDETDMLYIAMGRLSYYKDDTIGSTLITKDTCQKKLIYEVNMIQRDTTLAGNGLGAAMSMFCSVENIPADYEVEVKYKYVPIQ